MSNKYEVNPNWYWLDGKDKGRSVVVAGHWSGDFQGTVKYAGRELAIITNADGDDIEVCYMHPIEFHKL